MLGQNKQLMGDIEKALSGSARSLCFAPQLEIRYEADTRKERSRSAAICGTMALLIYGIFVFTDHIVVPDVIGIAYIIRFGIVAPLMLLGVWMVWNDPTPGLREALIAVFPIIITASLLFLMLVSQAPLRGYQQDGVVLVLIYQVMMQRPRFRFAVGAVATCVALYTLALMLVPEIPDPIKISKPLVLSGGAFFILLGCYRLERQHRLYYALSLQNLIRHQELDAISQTDPLTGLGNRRRLDNFFEDAVLSQEHVEKPIAVLILDIDRFKLFNDRYGHIAGDGCLALVARLAASRLRPVHDLAVRFGGEELVFILPGHSIEQAGFVAEDIRSTVEHAGIKHQENQSGVVTVSIGVASAPLGLSFRPVELLAAADAALYLAKQKGRNRVCSGLVLASDTARSAEAV